MDNLAALRALCTAIANTFYPDEAPLRLALLNAGLEADARAAPKDARLLRAAASLVLGYVEASRSENGISATVRSDKAIAASLRAWAREYGVDENELLAGSQRTITDGTNLW